MLSSQRYEKQTTTKPRLQYLGTSQPQQKVFLYIFKIELNLILKFL